MLVRLVPTGGRRPVNRPYGWDGPNPYAPRDRAEQERIDEWEAAVQAEARAVIVTLTGDDYSGRIRRAAQELLAELDEQEERQ